MSLVLKMEIEEMEKEIAALKATIAALGAREANLLGVVKDALIYARCGRASGCDCLTSPDCYGKCIQAKLDKALAGDGSATLRLLEAHDAYWQSGSVDAYNAVKFARKAAGLDSENK